MIGVVHLKDSAELTLRIIVVYIMNLDKGSPIAITHTLDRIQMSSTESNESSSSIETGEVKFKLSHSHSGRLLLPNLIKLNEERYTYDPIPLESAAIVYASPDATNGEPNLVLLKCPTCSGLVTKEAGFEFCFCTCGQGFS